MKIKNNIIVASTLLLLLTVTSSCDEFLDVKPDDSFETALLYNKVGDVELGMAGMYRSMQETYQRKFFYWGEFRADNFDYGLNNVDETRQLIGNNISDTNGEMLRWGELYSTIGKANLAIQKIPLIPNVDTNVVNNALAEAYSVRAYCYFDAYRVWGKAPIYTEFVSTLPSVYKTQSSGTEVLNLVLSDIAKAKGLFITQKHRFRFSYSSLLILEAKVLMHIGKYPEAKAVLDEFMVKNAASFKFALAKTRKEWIEMFRQETETGPELIMSLRATLAEGGSNISNHNVIFNISANNLATHPVLIAKWKSKFPTTQLEWEAKYGTTILPPADTKAADGITPAYGDWRLLDSQNSLSPNRITKYHIVASNSLNDDTDIILFRLADVVLLRAELECLVAGGNLTTALNYVDEIRVGRQLPKVKRDGSEVDITNANSVLNFVLEERQLELFAEGDRWWDLQRTKKLLEVLGNRSGREVLPTKTLFPVYFIHRDNNKLLEQTDGYN